MFKAMGKSVLVLNQNSFYTLYGTQKIHKYKYSFHDVIILLIFLNKIKC